MGSIVEWRQRTVDLRRQPSEFTAMAVELDVLDELARKRDSVIEQLVVAFEHDPRIVGAWLSGSFGRGEADQWSDLDLHVAIDDGAFEAVIGAPGELFALGGEPLLVQGGFPSDSVPGGTFWLVIYPGPVEIDWNVGPAGLAAKPAASLVLIEKRSIPWAASQAAPMNAEIVTKAQAQIEFFWAMAPIACKYAGRGHTRLAIEQCGLLRRSFLALWRAVHAPEHLGESFHQNRPMEATVAQLLPRFSTTVTPLEALAAVEEFCREVEHLHLPLEALGVRIPVAMPGELRNILDIARVAAARGGTNPHGGSRR